MKKMVLALLSLVLSCGLWAQDLKVYNNGSMDFVPPGTSYSLSASDQMVGVSKVYYRINTGEQAEYSAPLVFNDEGRFTVTYWSEDLLGNQSVPQSFTFFVDGTAPTLKYSARDGSFLRDSKLYLKSTSAILLQASDLGSGVEGIYFSLDKTNYIQFKNEAYVNKPGEQSVWAYAVDHLGNKSEPLEIKLVVDDDSPAVTIDPNTALLVVQGERYSAPGNSFSVQASDDLAGLRSVEVSINRQEFFTYSEPLVITEPGFYSVRARATNNLGTVSPVTELTFSVDRGGSLTNTVGKPQLPSAASAQSTQAPAQ